MTNNELRDLLEQNQRTISETTGLPKRLHELSVAIAESHQEQIRELKLAHFELKDAHLAFAVETKQAFLRLIELQAKADTRMDRVEAALDRLEEMLERFLRGQRGNGNPPQA